MGRPGKPGEIQEVESRIAYRTQQLCALYDRLDEISEQRLEILEAHRPLQSPDQYEEMRKGLAKSRPEVKRLAQEIECLIDELDELHEHLAALQGRRRGARDSDSVDPTQGGPDQPGSEEIALEKQLNEIADAQEEAIRRWNEKPVEQERCDFEARVVQLHEKFSEILARRNQLREARRR